MVSKGTCLTLRYIRTIQRISRFGMPGERELQLHLLIQSLICALGIIIGWVSEAIQIQSLLKVFHTELAQHKPNPVPLYLGSNALTVRPNG